MDKNGRGNSGKSKDIVVLEQLESALADKYFDKTVTISANNLRWLIHRAGRWVRRGEDGY